MVQGGARYVADLTRPGLLHAAVVRAPEAHGVIAELRLPDPADHPGMVAAFGPDELRRRIVAPLPVLWTIGEQPQRHTRPIDDRVRYVGQPVGVVVGTSEAAVADAVGDAELVVRPLPVVTTPEAALAPDAPLLYPAYGTNVLSRFEVGSSAAEVAAAMATAGRTLSVELGVGRLCGTPLETRGLLVEPDPYGEQLTVWTSSQAPHAVRDALATTTGLAQHRIRVVCPDIGGGFGLKDHLYEDELFVVLAALALRRPLRWIEGRAESLSATTNARDERYRVTVGFDLDGTLRALDVDAVRNAGAHLSIFGAGPLYAMAGSLPGPYRWDAVRATGRVVATNTTPTGAYRGFGQPQAAFIRERVVELVAAETGLDPYEVRRRNAVTAAEQPWTTPTALTYDSGDYPAALERARELAAAAAAGTRSDDGRRRGVGWAMYVQLCGVGNSATNELIGLHVGGYETAVLRMERDGTVQLLAGITPHGQSHATTFAQLVADRLGIEPEAVTLAAPDTDRTPYSAYGTAASRSMAVGGAATVRAAEVLAGRLRALAADRLEANPADVELVDGVARVVGTPSRQVTLRALAEQAWAGFRLPEGAEAGLHAMVVHDPPSETFSYAVHVAAVAVDPETGAVEIERYGVVHDCGTVVNPMVVEGQIHGGIAQGAAAALQEELRHDPDGQPLGVGWLDYGTPSAELLPAIEIVHLCHPAPHVPGGMKGMGEGGTNGSFAAVANAVLAAVGPDAARHLTTTPFTAERVRAALDATG